MNNMIQIIVLGPLGSGTSTVLKVLEEALHPYGVIVKDNTVDQFHDNGYTQLAATSLMQATKLGDTRLYLSSSHSLKLNELNVLEGLHDRIKELEAKLLTEAADTKAENVVLREKFTTALRAIREVTNASLSIAAIIPDRI